MELNPDIVIYAGNPQFEALKSNKMMDALRDRTFPHIDISALLGNESGCLESQREDEEKRRRINKKRRYLSIDE